MLVPQAVAAGTAAAHREHAATLRLHAAVAARDVCRASGVIMIVSGGMIRHCGTGTMMPLSWACSAAAMAAPVAAAA